MFLLSKIDRKWFLLDNAKYMKKDISLKRIKGFGKKFFTRTNLLIILLIIFFVFLAVFLFKKAREDKFLDKEPAQVTEFDVQMSELDSFKEEVNYTPPTEEELKKQIEELEELRKARMGE
jgi:flagellar biosynthesis/type III secretory pathway M-ring protein FliF/YscJ